MLEGTREINLSKPSDFMGHEAEIPKHRWFVLCWEYVHSWAKTKTESIFFWFSIRSLSGRCKSVDSWDSDSLLYAVHCMWNIHLRALYVVSVGLENKGKNRHRHDDTHVPGSLWVMKSFVSDSWVSCLLLESMKEE